MFLPGKREIEDVREAMVSRGVDPQWVVAVHADLDDRDLDRALSEVDHPKAMLSTSLAESSITLPQVDHVLDAGFSRSFHDYHGILSAGD